MRKLKTIKAVEKELKIDDINNLPEDKYDDLARLMPKIDKEVALNIISHMPDFVSFAKEFVVQMTQCCETIVKEGGAFHKEVVSSYQMILNSLNELLKKEDLSSEEKKEITDKMILVADKISQEGDKYREFLKGCLEVAGKVGAVALAFVGVLVVIATGANGDKKE